MEQGKSFVVDFLVGAEDGGMDVEGCGGVPAAVVDGQGLAWCGRAEEVGVDLEAEFRREGEEGESR